ncbi:MAG: nucleoside-diphosphate kinase [Anaerolineales bacterium]
MERTLILVKPDGVQRGLIGEVIARLERRGLKMVGLKFLQVDRALAERHYAVHKGKPFYEGLLAYISSAPVVAMVLEGPNAIALARQMMGSTRPGEAAPGSLRADFAVEIGRNLVHGSDSAETAAYEIPLFFKPEELVSWKRATDPWIFE